MKKGKTMSNDKRNGFINKIGFIGLGLIGGSIAKAIQKYYPEIRLYGHASRQTTLAAAHDEGVIENDDFLPLEEFAHMDIVFLCSPVRCNIDYLRRLAPLLDENCLLTDVGSVKGEIQKAADELGLSAQFIGGHPMTGSEKDGFAFSSAQLLENAYYILTRNPEIDEVRFNKFKVFISSIGSLAIEATPTLHDHATAAISHLPHIISATLVRLIRDNDTPDGIMRTIAAGGFKDITRISSSSPVMWQNICMENRDELLHLIQLYEEALHKAEEMVSVGDEEELLSFFSGAKDYRDSLPIRGNGLLPRANDFYLDLADETGQIAIVATLLATAGISLKNIGIVHNREFEEGVLHIDVYNEADKDQAMQILTDHGYKIHRRN
ncbi:MAG: prephenate dehydrogenase [Lachnospiraceae bacterium]|nr:prephenate dehydrogenase [Lachnospiraceae bacterium]